jgi:hypothetical protein
MVLSTIIVMLASCASTAQAVSPLSAEQCLRRGELALHSADTIVQSISEFHCALNGPPQLALKAHRGLAIAYAEVGEQAKAINHYEAYRRLQPLPADQAEVERRLRTIKPRDPNAAAGDKTR